MTPADATFWTLIHAAAPEIVMTPNDPTLTHDLQELSNPSEAAWNAGMAAAFGPVETGSYHTCVFQESR